MSRRKRILWIAVGTAAWAALAPGSPAEEAPDAVPPRVKVASPAEGQHVRGVVDIEVDCSDDRGVKEVSVSRDGAFLESTAASPFRVEWDTRKEMEGPHSLIAKALDGAGNQGTSPLVTVTVDNTPPTVKLIQPARRQTITGKTPLEATASDLISVAEVRFTVDGIPVGSVRRPPYSVPWESKTISNGVHVVEARAFDLAGNSALFEPVEIRVSNPNKAPVLSSIGLKSVFEGEAVEFRLNAMDPDGPRDTVTYRGIDLPKWVKLDPRTGEVKAEPDAKAVSTAEQKKIYPLRFQACDPEPLCASIEVPLTVTNFNRAPEIPPIPPLSVREGETVSFQLPPALDPDGDTLVYTAGSLPGWLRFDPQSRAFNGVLGFDVATLQEPEVSYTATVKVADPDGLTDEKNMKITVLNKNRPPVFGVIKDKSIEEGKTFAFTVTAADPDGDAVTIDGGLLPFGAAFQDANDGSGVFLWATRTDQSGSYKIIFTATDGELKDVEPITVTLEEISLSISGRITDVSGRGFPEAKIQLTTAGQPQNRVSADENGYFIASGLRAATYTVKPIYEQSEDAEEFVAEAQSSVGYHFVPLSKRVSVDREDERDVNFTAHPK